MNRVPEPGAHSSSLMTLSARPAAEKHVGNLELPELKSTWNFVKLQHPLLKIKHTSSKGQGN